MPKKKCPACGSTETVKILYGMPTYEAFQASERGEIALGGCCVTENDPSRHCNNCGQDFGGRDLLEFYDIDSFEFFVGGFFGTSHYIYINGKRKNKIIKYAEVPGGIFVDLKHPKTNPNDCLEALIKEILLTDIQWLEFLHELKGLEISCWKDEYVINDICDGTQWSLIIKLPSGKKINKYGSNEYPPYWKKFIKVLSKYIGYKIS